MHSIADFVQHKLKILLKTKTENLFIQIFRFLIVGAISFAVDFSVLTCFTEFVGLHYLVSSGLGFVFGLTVNYILSVRWVFATRAFENRHHEFLIFLTIGLIGLGLNQLFMWLFTSEIGTHYMISKVITTVIVSFFNFFARKFLLFYKGSKSEY